MAEHVVRLFDKKTAGRGNDRLFQTETPRVRKEVILLFSKNLTVMIRFKLFKSYVTLYLGPKQLEAN